jgi:hypothetical protein
VCISCQLPAPAVQAVLATLMQHIVVRAVLLLPLGF